MKKGFLLVFFIVGFVKLGISQKSLSDYSYIVVSEQFEFQEYKNEYELNSLTKFLFNKYGFYAYFENEIPKNVSKCDGLWSEVIELPGFVYTNIEVVIKDCNGIELFRTEKGSSKIKEYKKAYVQSLRNAFVSIEELGVQQKEISQEVVLNKEKEAVLIQTVSEKTEVKTIKNGITSIGVILNLPTNKYTSYSYINETYLLRKTKSGYSLYKESKIEEEDLKLVGKLTIVENVIYFSEIPDGKYKASFDTSKNLSVDKNGKLIRYKIQD